MLLLLLRYASATFSFTHLMHLTRLFVSFIWLIQQHGYVIYSNLNTITMDANVTYAATATATAAASTNDVKYLVLLLLIVQNSALNLVMRYTRASVPSDQQYLASTAVFMNECVKLVVCFGALYTMTCRRSFSRLVKLLHHEFITQWPFAVKTAVPAIIYLIQVTYT